MLIEYLRNGCWLNSNLLPLKTVKEQNIQTYRDRGSKFIGYLFGCSTRELFEEALGDIHSEHPNATHHCYGWRIDPTAVKEFANDDGEPSGTAGMPILNQLKSFEVVNAGLVVVRHFGGTKLGKSGLIEAYGETAFLCLSQAKLLQILPTQNFKISYPYHLENRVSQLINTYSLKTLDSDYGEKVEHKMACPESLASQCLKAIEQLEHLDIRLEKLGSGYIFV